MNATQSPSHASAEPSSARCWKPAVTRAAARAAKIKRSAGATAGLLLATTCFLGSSISSQAGSLTTDFSSDPGASISNKGDAGSLVRDGVLKLVDLADLIDPTTGQFDEHRLPLQGSYIFPELDPGQKIASFTISFKARMGGGTERGAQGFSLVLANDFNDSAPFREGGGGTTGLTISFDEIDGAAPAAGAAGTSEGNDPGDAPGIIVKQKGQKVIAKQFDGLRTDAPGTGHPALFVPVQVALTPDGLLSVTYNNTKVFDNVPIGYIPTDGRFGFGAGTEEQTAILRDNFWIDDVSITTTPLSGAAVVSVEPATQNAAPDAAINIGIQGLGTGTVQLQVDNKDVTATKSDAGGGITLVSFRPSVLFDPGSTHTVKLVYGGKTFQYGFTVAKSPIIPATAAAAAGSVDTSKAGFKLRVYQVESGVTENSAARGEKELAGLLGPNTADLSVANSDGTFNKDTINFEQDGSAAGDIDGDELIPGIPGNSSNPTDNIAMEVTGFLDLKPGAYTIGSVSDDSIKVTIGGEPRDVTALTLFDIAIGRATGSFIIQQAGLYPFRAIWTEGGGGANIELWSEDASGMKILLNDLAKAGAIKSYRQRAAGFKVPPYLSGAKPAPSEENVSTTPKIQLEITDDGTVLDPNSIKLSINDTAVSIPAGAVTKSGNITTIKVDVAQPLEPNKPQKLGLQFADNAGKTISREYFFTTGKSAGGSALNSVKGYWTFEGKNLKAKVGRDMAYVDESLASRYKFGVTGQGDFATVPLMNGKPANVLLVPYVPDSESDAKGQIFKRLGLRMNHDIPPNGGGQKVNQYTVIMDILWGDGTGYGAVWQLHDLDNPGDSDMYWQESTSAYGKSCCSSYQAPNQKQARWQWARVAFAVDLTANPPVLAKYINGIKNLDTIGGTRGHIDSEFALSVPEIVLFGDSDNENSEAYLSAVQVREGRMTDEEIAALKGPDPAGIPLPYSQWNFNDPARPLAAEVGHDLEFVDPALASRYKTGVTGQGDFANVPLINGKPANVLLVPYVPDSESDAQGQIFKRLGLRLNHGLAANGGGQKVNQYTVIMDLLWGDGTGYGAVWQLHDLNNPGDSDMYWQESTSAYGKSCCSAYQAPNQKQARWQWGRVAFAVDLAANPPILAKYINGVKNIDAIGGTRGHIDSEFALSIPEIVLFGDSDNENSDAYISSLQVRQGRMSDDQIAALGGPTASGIPSPNPVKGEWNFDDAANPLAATVGSDMQFVDAALASRYKAGVTGQGDFANVPLIKNKPAKVLLVPYVPDSESDAKGQIFKRLGLRMPHGVEPNGGGQKVNQYTVILDLLWGDGTGYGAVWQLHDLNNPGDSDMYWQESTSAYGKSCCSAYQAPNQKQARWQWGRIAFAVDLTANPPILAKYINGVKNIDAIGGTRGHVDSEFALSVPEIVLFGDSDNENSDAYINAVQVREGRMSDEEIAALGGPDPDGIPAAAIGAAAASAPPTRPQLKHARSGANLTLSWDGAGFTLESTPTLTNPSWSAVAGAANNSIVIQVGPGTRFYRLRK